LIEDTLKSIQNQLYNDIEYIVIDGNSNDGTIDLLRQYSDSITTLIIEEDESMYEAINKGLKLCTGEIIGILNSDDILYNELTIQKIVQYFISNDNISGVYGDIILFNSEGKKYRKVFQINFQNLLSFGKGTIVPHPTLYVRREVYQRYEYDLKYKYAADYDLILRAIRKYKIVYLNTPIVRFRQHEGSITASKVIGSEANQIRSKYISRDKVKYILWRKWLIWAKYSIYNILYRVILRK
jgi:glycosyltransferase involved in cell wall biosynthesis